MLLRTLNRRLSIFAIVVLGGAMLRCKSDRAGFTDPSDAGPQSPLVAPSDAGVDSDADADAPSAFTGECSGENKQIYVASRRPDAIYRFDPEALTFALVGYPDCGDQDIYSMAIDRRGVAWIEFLSGMMFNLRLDDFRCSEVALNRPPRTDLFGMGFAKDDSPEGETLYLADTSLYRLDRTNLDVVPIGPILLPAAELTGTGDGRLYGFSPYNGLVAQFDKGSGASLVTYRTPVVESNAYAFAQWGGDFWIFSRTYPEPSSFVTRFSPATGESKVVIEDTGLVILGAGSSTCAPYEPVH